ncbi:[4Fe-4S] proteins maturation [Friedmanniomyces endolithicus]|uniref:[4Fe-4S] proteins maturation n=1 Tax=Friedmanniomyces endolithicus TaxID=329885 RepID=A0AAN6KME7_9PEZI|nr:[4Fe-4S] proteins maturation [Friedmanniomyces endolithicus]KAK0771914.1 [4Fe-4S] proteins maturation [Friedmanniomyces endolithicus]KAK0796801.1 [4Fe-4S] proteins maturation [Friedmanniomyces endolithicus]KAK0842058.1 [4Fe-4S] proteins maturation [Friedmanniomyces endolithicus]KAK0855352.1 [4Fe-4S] proteins maturation [Friedmanniomyces endolithicus]
MASRTIAATCEQAMNHRILPAYQRATHTVAQRRHLHTPPPPLLLDFLAPSWRPRLPLTPSPWIAAISPTPRPSQRRPFSSTPHRPLTKAIANPRHDDAGNQMTVTISPRAAHRLKAISEKDANPDLALRVSVESGGCHGFQYLMSLINVHEDVDKGEDTVFEDEPEGNMGGEGGYRAKVVMDEPSLELLKGSRVDYTMELIGSQFKVVGIPGAKSSCGCGTSFDVA